MGTRLELQTVLEKLLGSTNVYFQEPPNNAMRYPAIVYHLSDIDTQHASNLPYRQTNEYLLTVIDRSPEMVIVDKVKRLPRCSFSRFFVEDNLNHYNFNIYF